jgi:hypothetical protein
VVRSSCRKRVCTPSKWRVCLLLNKPSQEMSRSRVHQIDCVYLLTRRAREIVCILWCIHSVSELGVFYYDIGRWE